MITQTYCKLQRDSEKYGRELSQDCSVKRVMSTREPTVVKADEKLCGKNKTLKCKHDQHLHLTLKPSPIYYLPNYYRDCNP